MGAELELGIWMKGMGNGKRVEGGLGEFGGDLGGGGLGEGGKGWIWNVNLKRYVFGHCYVLYVDNW